MRLLPVLLAGLVAMAGCGQPRTTNDSDARLDLLDYLAGLRGTGSYSPGLAPHLVEVAWANGAGAASWPDDHPALDDVVVPEGGSLLGALRPLYALALADAPGADGRRGRVLDEFDGTQFGEPGLLNDDAFALLVLHADGQPDSSGAVVAAAQWLLSQQTGGGWPHSTGGQAGVDMTGMVLAALSSAGRLHEVPRDDVVAFLQSARDGDGFAERPGGAANCDSTVWALRSLSLLETESPTDAWSWLRELQGLDGGIRYRPGDGSANELCSAEVAVLWGLQATGRLGTPFV